MNHCYCLVWSDATERHVPAPETARGRGNSRAALTLAPALLLGALLALPAGAQTLPGTAFPTGGLVKSGGATIGAPDVNNVMTIRQPGAKAILEWTGFDIASGATVHFQQDAGAGAIALNRVTGGNASQIDGTLTATGQVWLVNPNGVMFGSGSRVNVGGLVASAMDITNQDFNAGRQVFKRGAARGGITNYGHITVAEGGALALLAPTVSNGDDARLRAVLGNVVLAGGNQVTLEAGAEGRLQVTVDPATVRTLIENKGWIVADGGQVLMTSRAADTLSASVVANGGYVQADTVVDKAGRILLLDDMQHGEVVFEGGLLVARANDGGNDGFVETSAAKVQIGNEAFVVTQGSASTGNWVVRAKELTIGAGNAAPATSGITADSLNRSLGNTSVTLQAVGSAGNIHVDAPFSWAQNTLTLDAQGSITVNAVLTASGTAGLEMRYGGHSATQPTAAAGSGVHMALPDSGFTGRVDFTGRDAMGASTNQLKINGDSYTILTRLGSAGSTTQQDLQGINGHLSGRYALGADIDATATRNWSDGAGFAPIGAEAAAFTGTFEGLGHTITGLSVNRPDQDYVGLFGDTSNATLRNVGLERGSVTGGNYVGALVGRNRATGETDHAALVGNVYSQVQVTGSHHVGGLIGQNIAQGANSVAHVFDVHSTGEVKGASRVGGLVGSNAADGGGKASIEKAYAIGAKVQGTENVGGVVGANLANSGEARLVDVESRANVDATGNNVGGVAGLNLAAASGSAFVYQAHATGTVQSKEAKVGGLIGLNTATGAGQATVMEGRATGKVTGSSEVGGLVGTNFAAANGTAEIFVGGASGEVTATAGANAGGLVGFNGAQDAVATVTYSDASGAVRGLDRVGGLVGSNMATGTGKAEISYATAAGEVAGRDHVGGLAGANQTGTGTEVAPDANAGSTARIHIAYATGTVKGSNHVGGLVGANSVHRGGTASIDEAYAAGTEVTASVSAAGGLVGSNMVRSGGTARISDAYASAAVSSGGSAGGLVGEQMVEGAGAAVISRTYATGKASSAGGAAGGLMGRGNGTIDRSIYATTDAQGNPINAGTASFGQGKTFADLRKLSIFEGWDIDDQGGTGKTWRIYEGATMPLLRRFLTEGTVKIDDADLHRQTYNGAVATGVVGTPMLSEYEAPEGSLLGQLRYASTGKNAGTYKVADGTLVFGGLYSDQQGYDIVYESDASLTIDRKVLTIDGTQVHDKTYDGHARAPATAGQLQGLVPGEALNVGASGLFDSRNAGRHGATVAYALGDGSGGLAGNYALADTRHSATIEKAPLTIRAANAGKLEGDFLAFDGTEFLAGPGLVRGETVRRVALSSLGTAANAGAGSHAIVASDARGDGGFEAGNYDIRYVSASVHVSPASSSDVARLWPCSSAPSQLVPEPCAVQQRAHAAMDVSARMPALTIAADFIRTP